MRVWMFVMSALMSVFATLSIAQDVEDPIAYAICAVAYAICANAVKDGDQK